MFSSERLKGIDVFVCVSEAGSFQAAAEKMHLTGSAVSKSIARLEARLGTKLFHRTTRRLSLTDAGIAFNRTCSGVLADLEKAELALLAENTELCGRVRIDLPSVFGRAQVLPIILHFVENHPLVIPHISFSDGFVDPFQEGVDIVVSIGDPKSWPDSVGHRRLANEWHTFCASPVYLGKHGTPLSDRDLNDHKCIAYGWIGGDVAPWNFAGDSLGDGERRPLPVHLVMGNGEGLVAAVLAGCGIAQLPTWLIKRQLDDGTLIEVLAHLAADGMPINLAWNKSRQQLPKISALLEVLTTGLTAAGASYCSSNGPDTVKPPLEVISAKPGWSQQARVVKGLA